MCETPVATQLIYDLFTSVCRELAKLWGTSTSTGLCLSGLTARIPATSPALTRKVTEQLGLNFILEKKKSGPELQLNDAGITWIYTTSIATGRIGDSS